jgi:hypothetical protein
MAEKEVAGKKVVVVLALAVIGALIAVSFLTRTTRTLKLTTEEKRTMKAWQGAPVDGLKGDSAAEATPRNAENATGTPPAIPGQGQMAPQNPQGTARAPGDGTRAGDSNPDPKHPDAAPAAGGSAPGLGEKADAPLGTLSKEHIQNAMQAARPRVKACFDKALPKDPDLAGKVVIQFEIEAEDDLGKIARGEVAESETDSPFFDACVLKSIRGLEFDAPQGGGKVVVRYPFLFDPGGGFGGKAPAP